MDQAPLSIQDYIPQVVHTAARALALSRSGHCKDAVVCFASAQPAHGPKNGAALCLAERIPAAQIGKKGMSLVGYKFILFQAVERVEGSTGI
jgi:hypothetical protein